MTNRFAEAVKRIVEPLIPKKGGGDPQKEKTPIAGNRSLAYQEADGSTGVIKGTPGVTQAPGTATGVGGSLLGGINVAGDAATEAREGAAQGSNQNDPANGISGATQGVYHIDIVLGGTGPAQSESQDSSTTATTSYGASTGQKLLGLTGLVDCDTSNPMEVRFDGFYIPPVTWETADTPPTTSGPYLPGIDLTLGYTVEWSDHVPTISDCPAPGTAFIYYASGAYRLAVVDYVTTITTPTSGWTITGYLGPYTSSSCPGYPPTVPEGVSFLYHIQSGGSYCPYGYTEDGLSCVLGDANAALWPVSGQFQLSLGSDGNFAGHSRDSEVPANYATPSSTLRACTEAGATVEIKPLKNGGFALYELVAGAPSGVVQVYRSDKTLSGYTDTSGLAMLLP